MRYQKLLSFILVLFFFVSTVVGQKAPIKWGKTPAEDLAMTSYELDPDAEAVVLCDYGRLYFEQSPKGWVYRFVRHKRIKVLKTSATDLGNISIDYYSHKGSEKVGGIKAQVISPDGKKQSIKKKNVFTDKVNDYWSRKRFAIPNIQEGSVIEYKYELISDRWVTLQDWYFQDDIPTRHSELRTAIPEFLDYIFLFQSKNNIAKTSLENGGGIDPSFGGAKIINKSYIMKNLPALKEESFVTTMNDYRARIKFQLRAYIPGNGQLTEMFLSNWNEVAKSFIKRERFGKQYLKKSRHKKLLTAAAPYLAKVKTPKEKIRAAQTFINDNVAWTGNYGIYVEDRGTLDKLFEKKEARKGEMNLMLLTLLKSEGINAWPILSSTRSHGKMFPLYPIVDQFSHTMVYVDLGDEQMVLDISDGFHPMGYPTINSLNGRGWVVDEENPRWIDILAPKSVERYLATVSLDEEGNLTGSISGSIEGYAAIRERKNLQEEENGSWQEDLRESYPEALIDSVQIENKDRIYEPLLVNMKCNLPGAGQINGDFIYLSPVLLEAYDENPFKLERRDYPVDIPYPFSDSYVLNLEIPEGYAIEELPESVNMVLPNKGGKFQFLVNPISEKRIQIVTKVRIKQLIYSPEEYLAVKRFFDLIVEKEGEQIVLKKKS
ncbi:MAG: hypothetical protein ACI8YQ_000235 [Polaribacter sp.]|jgi:hypothetical protein